jgi:hypothetical protein
MFCEKLLEKENVLLKLSFLHNKFFCRGPYNLISGAPGAALV